VFTHLDGETLLTGEDAGLLHHALKVAVDLLTAGVDIAGPRHGTNCEAATGGDAALLALIVVVILLAGQGQVAADIGRYLVTTYLRAIEVSKHADTFFANARLRSANRAYGPNRTCDLGTSRIYY